MNAARRALTSEAGFTMLEIIMMLIILGLLAAMIIPRVTSFARTGNLGAANTEVQNVRTAAIGYRVDQGVWPARTDDPTYKRYFTGDLRAVYLFDTDGSGAGIGFINNAITTGVPNPWPTAITFDNVTQKWK